jgi:hypothetical protein
VSTPIAVAVWVPKVTTFEEDDGAGGTFGLVALLAAVVLGDDEAKAEPLWRQADKETSNVTSPASPRRAHRLPPHRDIRSAEERSAGLFVIANHTVSIQNSGLPLLSAEARVVARRTGAAGVSDDNGRSGTGFPSRSLGLWYRSVPGFSRYRPNQLIY